VAGPERAQLAAGLGFVLVSFALNSVMTRLIVGRGLLDPGLTTTVRFVAGAAALLLLLGARHRLSDARPSRANLAPAFWLGAYAVLISYGYQHITAAAGTFVFYACVLVTMALVGALVEKQRPLMPAMAGGVLALAGVGMLALGRVEGSTPLGVALLAGTGASWGAYSILGRRRPDALAFTSSNFLVLALPLLVFGAALVGTGRPWTGEGVALAAFMGAVTTALSYAVWYWALARLGRIQAGTYQLAIPVLTGLMGIALLAEAFTPQLALAGALVVAGMALATLGSGSMRSKG
jgi:drug/metabolite transporter (DMT)-like permease